MHIVNLPPVAAADLPVRVPLVQQPAHCATGWRLPQPSLLLPLPPSSSSPGILHTGTFLIVYDSSKLTYQRPYFWT